MSLQGAASSVPARGQDLAGRHYHAFGFRKYAHRYLGQVQYLFNRMFNLRTILERLARAASQAAPCHLRDVRAAAPSC